MLNFLNPCKEKNKILNQMEYKIIGYDDLKDISEYKFPEVVLKRAKEELKCGDEEIEIVSVSLLTYFSFLKKIGDYPTGPFEMIDKSADILWHNFLLDTREYMKFCSEYVGRYIHHTPYIEDKRLSEEEILSIKMKYKNELNGDPGLNQRAEKAYVRIKEVDDLAIYSLIGVLSYEILEDQEIAKIKAEQHRIEQLSSSCSSSHSSCSSSHSSCSSSHSSSCSSSSCSSGCGGS